MTPRFPKAPQNKCLSTILLVKHCYWLVGGGKEARLTIKNMAFLHRLRGAIEKKTYGDSIVVLTFASTSRRGRTLSGTRHRLVGTSSLGTFVLLERWKHDEDVVKVSFVFLL